MEKLVLAILVSICLSVSVLAQQGSRPKSGFCPKTSDFIGVCSFDPSKNCLDDGACPRNQKCCSDGCNKICQDPRIVSSSAVEKRGQCPKSDNTVGICRFDPSKNCLSDGACPQNQKCCSDGCNKICKDPESEFAPTKVVKRGKCPKSEGIVGICSFDPSKNCDADDRCSGQQKCCPNGCGSVCKDPVQRQKLGRCPKIGHPGICNINAERCETDTDCPINLKCCSDSCNLKCLPAVLGRRA